MLPWSLHFGVFKFEKNEERQSFKYCHNCINCQTPDSHHLEDILVWREARCVSPPLRSRWWCLWSNHPNLLVRGQESSPFDGFSCLSHGKGSTILTCFIFYTFSRNAIVRPVGLGMPSDFRPSFSVSSVDSEREETKENPEKVIDR